MCGARKPYCTRRVPIISGHDTAKRVRDCIVRAAAILRATDSRFRSRVHVFLIDRSRISVPRARNGRAVLGLARYAPVEGEDERNLVFTKDRVTG